jgi:hypothetical protein
MSTSPDWVRFPFVLRSGIGNRLFQPCAVCKNSVKQRDHPGKDNYAGHVTERLKPPGYHSDLLPPFDPVGCTRYIHRPILNLYGRTDVAGLVSAGFPKGLPTRTPICRLRSFPRAAVSFKRLRQGSVPAYQSMLAARGTSPPLGLCAFTRRGRRGGTRRRRAFDVAQIRRRSAGCSFPCAGPGINTGRR